MAAKFKKTRKTQLKKTTIRIMSGSSEIAAIKLPEGKVQRITWSLRHCPSLGRITGCFTCEPGPGLERARKR